MNNRVLNETINGFSMSSLGNIIYDSSVHLDGNVLSEQINCQYVRVDNVKNLDRHVFSTVSHNIRSMKSNFHNFQAEIMNDFDCDVIGLCETRLTDDTAKLYALNNYNLYCNNVSSNMGGV